MQNLPNTFLIFTKSHFHDIYGILLTIIHSRNVGFKVFTGRVFKLLALLRLISDYNFHNKSCFFGCEL